MTFQCALDSAPFTECPDPSEYTGLTAGQHILRVRAVDLALNVDASPASWTWTVVHDSTAPVTTINTAETVVVEGEATRIYSFTANEPLAEFECSIDNEPFEQCESPMEYSGLTPGEHRFRVRAIDLAGNHEQPPVTDTFEIGIGPAPDTTILTGPAATVPDDWASFEFSSNQANATFECAIDAEPFEECFNPTQYTELEPGQHTFRVRALNSSLVPDPTPGDVDVELRAARPRRPETTIVTTPPNPQLTLNAVFQFSSSGGPEIEFQCALDAEPFESCESPYLIEELPPGEHVFLVKAVDLFLGTEDPTPARYEWRSIAPPLEPTIDSAPADPSVGDRHEFSFSSTEPNATFECRITPNPFHNNTFEPCESPHAYTGLPDGEYLFQVRAVNEYGIAGEIPAEHSFEVANPPDTTIVGGPSGTTESTTGGIAFTSSEPGSEFECSYDGEPFVECLSPAVFPDTDIGWPEWTIGTHTFVVQAIDSNGNVDPTPASRTWTVVAPTAPETQIVAGPDATTSSTTASFGFSSEPGATFECSLDNAAFAPCPSPPVYENLSVGNHQLRVAAKDVDGNVDPTPAVYTWTITEPDTVDPETTIGSTPSDPTNHTDATFTFTSNETGSRFRCSLDGAPFEPCSSAKVYTGLAAGQHTFAVAAIDPSNNADETPASHTWTIDRAAPDTADHEPAVRPEPRRLRQLRPRGHRQRERRGRDQLRVPPRRRRMGPVRRPEVLREPDRGPAHVLGAGDRRRRQRRPVAGLLQLDGRHGRAGDDDLQRPADASARAPARPSRSPARPA